MELAESMVAQNFIETLVEALHTLVPLLDASLEPEFQSGVPKSDIAKGLLSLPYAAQ